MSAMDDAFVQMIEDKWHRESAIREKAWDDVPDSYSTAKASIDGMRDCEAVSVVACNNCKTAALMYRLTGKGKNAMGDDMFGHEYSDYADVYDALPESMQAEMATDYLHYLIDDGRYWGSASEFLEDVLGGGISE